MKRVTLYQLSENDAVDARRYATACRRTYQKNAFGGSESIIL